MSLTPEEIDAILPQTQCGLCGYGGCLPYAEALIHHNAPINLCPPGGIPTLITLGKMLAKNPTPYLLDMQQKTKKPQLAIIREAECIGCTKCIQACPVDAIIGSAKQMHSVFTDICTGCELCIPPCPVDCIEMIPSTKPIPSPTISRKRYQKKQHRLLEKTKTHQQTNETISKKDFIQAALLRVKTKKEILEK